MKIVVIHGPNLNFLGMRNPAIYGFDTYDGLVEQVEQYATRLSFETVFFQSNSEGEIIDRIQQAILDKVDGMIINPGAYTHYSYAIRDAIEMTPFPVMEVHLSDIHNREPFRAISVIKEVCEKQIKGFGIKGYFMALDELKHIEKVGKT